MIALDSAPTHLSTSYLRLQFRVFIPEFNNIVNLHGRALPMHDQHTAGESDVHDGEQILDCSLSRLEHLPTWCDV